MSADRYHLFFIISLIVSCYILSILLFINYMHVTFGLQKIPENANLYEALRLKKISNLK